MDKPLKHIPFEDLEFTQRHTNGDIAEGVEVVGTADGTKLGFGYGKMLPGKLDEWKVSYDEVITCLEGAITVHAGSQQVQLESKDSVFIPKGTNVVYEPTEATILAYAILPADWAEHSML